MRHTWRWFGPVDKVTIADARQAGAEGIVTALHHIVPGEIWTPEEIAKRQAEVATFAGGGASGLAWEVVESLPVSEAIKTRTGDWQRHVDTWKRSMANLAAAGIEVICYNFMPVLDWTRTETAWRLPHGGTTMRFELTDFAVFDIHLLARSGARGDYAPEVVEAADARHAAMTSAEKDRLATAVNAGLPGEKVGGLDRLRAELDRYRGSSRSGCAPTSSASWRRWRRPRRTWACGSAAIRTTPVPPPRPAADPLHRSRLPDDPRRRAERFQRRHLLHRLPRRPPGQRSAGDGPASRPADPLRPPAQRAQGDAGNALLLP